MLQPRDGRRSRMSWTGRWEWRRVWAGVVFVAWMAVMGPRIPDTACKAMAMRSKGPSGKQWAWEGVLVRSPSLMSVGVESVAASMV